MSKSHYRGIDRKNLVRACKDIEFPIVNSRESFKRKRKKEGKEMHARARARAREYESGRSDTIGPLILVALLLFLNLTRRLRGSRLPRQDLKGPTQA